MLEVGGALRWWLEAGEKESDTGIRRRGDAAKKIEDRKQRAGEKAIQRRSWKSLSKCFSRSSSFAHLFRYSLSRFSP